MCDAASEHMVLLLKCKGARVSDHSAFKGPGQILKNKYIFLKAIFCPKKEKIILKIFGLEKHPLTTISFEISILEKSYRK